MPVRKIRGMASKGTQRLDVRELPTWERHPRIFSAFEQLPADCVLTLVTDHEPRPLRLQFEQRLSGTFVWEQRRIGSGRWEVALRRPRTAPSEIGAFFRQCPLLCDAADDTIEQIERHAAERSYERNATIAEQDAHWPYVGFVRTGRLAAIVTSENGRDQNIGDFLPHDAFGAVEAVDGGRMLSRIACASPQAHAVMLPRGILLTAVAADPAIARKLAIDCAQRARGLAERFVTLVSHPAIARVAAALLPYAAPDAGLVPTLAPLQRMTQSELAAVAGTAKEVAARAVAELEEAGALRRAHGHISHIDRARLQAFVPAD